MEEAWEVAGNGYAQTLEPINSAMQKIVEGA
jgi:hypothetical protein